MKCQSCGGATSVVNSRPRDTRKIAHSLVPKAVQEAVPNDWCVFRLRRCKTCKARFWTAEIPVTDFEPQSSPSR